MTCQKWEAICFLSPLETPLDCLFCYSKPCTCRPPNHEAWHLQIQTHLPQSWNTYRLASHATLASRRSRHCIRAWWLLSGRPLLSEHALCARKFFMLCVWLALCAHISFTVSLLTSCFFSLRVPCLWCVVLCVCAECTCSLFLCYSAFSCCRGCVGVYMCCGMCRISSFPSLTQVAAEKSCGEFFHWPGENQLQWPGCECLLPWSSHKIASWDFPPGPRRRQSNCL